MNLTPAEIDKKLAELDELLKYGRLYDYKPYAKQKEFHSKSLTYREVLLMANNQGGKTWCGGAEVAIHATGLYPKWWEGRRFTKPNNWWVAGPSGEAVRDTVQRVLMGRLGQQGTGMLPRDNIIEAVNGRGVADLLDYVLVKHVSGGISSIKLKNYEQGRDKWQGDTLDGVWFDEEPPEDIYTEGLTRTNATKGYVFMTFTPLKGMTEVVRKFLTEKSPDRSIVRMTIEDAEHIAPEERQRIINSYPEHERDARTKGIPMLGSGKVFPVAESLITYEPFKMPEYWGRLGALDFGMGHPTAAVKGAWDRDADVVYITHCYRRTDAKISEHVGVLKHWGKIPWVWPHDGLKRDAGSARPMANQYRDEGLDMLDYRITFEDGGNGVEAGIAMMLNRMETGRLKVASHLAEWFEEFRLYHRKDGEIVKLHDDIMSATRYLIMGLRYAKVERERGAALNDEEKLMMMSRRSGISGGGWMGS